MALYNLACIHYSGHGVKPDKEKACLYLQEAINSGHDTNKKAFCKNCCNSGKMPSEHRYIYPAKTKQV